MYRIERSALVPFSAEQMFELVNDVDSYQAFLPWCGASEEINREQDEVLASVTIAFKGIHKTFTTRNTLTPFEKTHMELVDGPFSQLSGDWLFKALGEDGCRISLELEFDFSNVLVAKALGPLFSAIADSMVDSFCRRAEQVYGS